MEEQPSGLGLHFRHDGITGVASSKTDNIAPIVSQPLDEVSSHATVFVSARDAQYVTQSCSHGNFTASDGNVAIHNQHNQQGHDMQQKSQLPNPNVMFPPPPPHPSTANLPPCQSTIQPSQIHPPPYFPKPPPAPSFPISVLPTLHPPPPIQHYQQQLTHQTVVPLQHMSLPQPPLGVTPSFPAHPAAMDLVDSVPNTLQHSLPSVTQQQQFNEQKLASLTQQSNAQTGVELTQQLDDAQTRQQTQQQNDAIERARAIARRFHIENTQHYNTTATAPDTRTSTIPSINYAQQRLLHTQHFQTKLQSFRLKNLSYVMKHEEHELRQHVNTMNQMTAYEERLQIQSELQRRQQREIRRRLEEKEREREQSGMIRGGGGIGSKEQRKVERVRKRQHNHSNGSNNNNNNNNTTATTTQRASLYLTNLPADGSITERTLHSLFGLYGRLDRVTMYRHRSTGEYKGDGLIVFGRDAVEEFGRRSAESSGVDLVESVCSQVRSRCLVICIVDYIC
mmetsp:Transcript_13058/g.28608  ORF Transcript_13058/g.28608 Transcript_13058/m.28608 type:complete len:508 (-) Transcript_13058:329-1852(-)